MELKQSISQELRMKGRDYSRLGWYSFVTMCADYHKLMPNHVHCILRISTGGGAALGEVLNMFKGCVTRLWSKQAGFRHGEKEL
jgi:hypothetical protein